jgi:hypothetical protein
LNFQLVIAENTMLVKPNATQLEGIVKKITRSVDGVGAIVEIDVTANLHPSPDDDFVGAKPGQTIEVFASVPETFERGSAYRFDTSLVGGPRKQQLIARAAKKIEPAKARLAKTDA